MAGKYRYVAPQNVATTVAQPLVARQRPVRPLPRPVAQVCSMKPRSNRGATTACTAWCTTRSRKGATELVRRLGSRISNET